MTDRITVSAAMYDFFREVGVTRMFGNPGSTELPMFRSFPDDWDYVLGLQESSVVGMADGYARTTGNASCVNLHSAAGVGHALGAIFTAFKNQAPMVIIAGQQSRSILPFEPFLHAERATEFPQPYVKWAIEPARAEDVPAAIARAYYIAMQTPRGPTFVSVPAGDWDCHCSRVDVREVAQCVIPDPKLLDKIATALAHAERPAFVVGAQASNDGAWKELVALAERHRARVFGSPLAARNAFPEDHPLFSGFLEPFREEVVAALSGHDVVFGVGAPMFLYHVEGSGPFLPPGTRAYQLVNDARMATWSPVGTAAYGDIKAGLAYLLDCPGPIDRAMPARRAAAPMLPRDRLTEAVLMSCIAEHLPADAIVVEEAPGSRGAIQTQMRMTNPDSYHTMASGGLGWGLPAAVGMALGSPGRRVLAILGDGSTHYSPQALWTAAQRGLSVTFVIIRNSRYSALERYGRLKFNLQRTVGTELPGIDAVKVAAGYGVPGVRVEDAANLGEALREASTMSGPFLIEAVTSGD
jgi:benzoylformate decarboxylase